MKTPEISYCRYCPGEIEPQGKWKLEQVVVCPTCGAEHRVKEGADFDFATRRTFGTGKLTLYLVKDGNPAWRET